MWNLLENPVFIVFAFLTITSVSSTVAYYWHKIHKTEVEAALKQEMIQRGMSADEIERVLRATASGKSSVPPDSPSALKPGAVRE
jgi:hypothetical protein